MTWTSSARLALKAITRAGSGYEHSVVQHFRFEQRVPPPSAGTDAGPVRRTALVDALGEVERGVLGSLAALRPLLRDAVEAAVSGDSAICDQVTGERGAIDRRYAEVHTQLLALLARQAPVASELRLALALLHANDYIERIGAQCMNLAEMAGATPCAEQVECLREMGKLTDAQLEEVGTVLADREVAGVERVCQRDAAINDHHRRCLTVAFSEGGEPAVFAAMMARAIERAGDHAVDIARQVSFAVDGRVRPPEHDPEALTPDG
jgi:phosphate transport system protein